MKCYAAVIAGSGPAGCATALSLARKRYDVLIADKARFPRAKTCGDGLSGCAVSLLQSLGVLDITAKKMGHPYQFRSILLTSPAGVVIEGCPPCKEGLPDYGSVIPRDVLDDCLLECLKKTENITLLEDTKITGVVKKNEQIVGIKSSTREFFGRCIIGADGPYSVIAAGISRLNRHRKHTGFALRAYFDGVAGLSKSIEIHYDKNMIPGYGWLLPVGKNRANVGVGIFTRFKNYHGIKKMFEDFVNKNPFVSVKLKKAGKVTDLLFKTNDFFDPNDLLQVKYEMVRKVQEDGWAVARAASTFGFSRLSFYKIQDAFKSFGILGLLPKKKGPKRASKLTDTVMAFINECLNEKPETKAGKLKILIKTKFGIDVHKRTIERIYKDKKKLVGETQ